MQIRFQNIKFYVLVFILLTSSVALTESNKLEIEIDNPKFSEKGLDDKTYEIKAKKGLKSDVQLKLLQLKGSLNQILMGDGYTWKLIKAHMIKP